MAEARAVNEEDDPLLLVLFKLQPDEGAGAAASVLALIELAGDGGEAALSSDGAGGISGSCCAMVVLLLGAHSLEVPTTRQALIYPDHIWQEGSLFSSRLFFRGFDE